MLVLDRCGSVSMTGMRTQTSSTPSSTEELHPRGQQETEVNDAYVVSRWSEVSLKHDGAENVNSSIEADKYPGVY